MSTVNSAPQKSENIQKSERYCIAALILLCLAIFFLSVVVFTLNPLTIFGIIAAAIGVLLMFGCIYCFARYNHYLNEEEKHVPEGATTQE